MDEEHPSGNGGATGPAPRFRPAAVVAVCVAAVILAVVGVAIGWLLAGSEKQIASPDTSGEPQTYSPPTQQSSAATRSQPAPPRRTTRPAPPGKQLPDLVGRDFEEARKEVRALGLGWQLIFAGSGDDKAVQRTVPEPGAPIRRGITVKLYVAGAAPLATVPGVVGLPCAQAAATVVDHGLYPEYAARKLGPVTQQSPDPPGDLRWNDRVKLYCGQPVDESSASPS